MMMLVLSVAEMVLLDELLLLWWCSDIYVVDNNAEALPTISPARMRKASRLSSSPTKKRWNEADSSRLTRLLSSTQDHDYERNRIKNKKNIKIEEMIKLGTKKKHK